VITSLTAIQARSAELANIARGHWVIEDQLRWARDMDWDEERSQDRTGNGPASWLRSQSSVGLPMLGRPPL
jgi:predicted transposase YbfD/YdcC